MNLAKGKGKERKAEAAFRGLRSPTLSPTPADSVPPSLGGCLAFPSPALNFYSPSLPALSSAEEPRRLFPTLGRPRVAFCPGGESCNAPQRSPREAGEKGSDTRRKGGSSTAVKKKKSKAMRPKPGKCLIATPPAAFTSPRRNAILL